MNWREIEQAIRAYAMDHDADLGATPKGDVIVHVREPVNISELARAIERAVTVKGD